MKNIKAFLILGLLLCIAQSVYALDTTAGVTTINVDIAASRGLSYGDFNGDGDLDMYVANRNQQNQIWLSDGAGDFTSNDIVGDTLFTHAVVSGDLDADGDIDIYAINVGGGAQNKLWINDGVGNFTNADIVGDTNNSYGGAIGDADNDGDLDLYVTVLGAQNKLWINDGAGNFTANDIVGDTGNSADAVFVDVDGDGDNDLYTGNFGQNKLWINDGAGNFTANDIVGDTHNTYGVAVGDVDADGDIDLYAVNDGGAQNKLWINDGAGNFTANDIVGDTGTSRKAAFADLDRDGDVDLYIVNNGANKLWINDGAGNFTGDHVSLDSGDSNAVILFDYDNDGDNDIFVANSGQQNKLWINDTPASVVSSSSSRRSGSVRRICRDSKALNYNPTRFGRHFDSWCRYGEVSDFGGDNDQDCDGIKNTETDLVGNDCDGVLNIDTDGDGIFDSIENSGPNNGDADGDGIPDKNQQDVTSLFNPVTFEYITLKLESSDCTAVTEAGILSEEDLNTHDIDAEYLLGLLDFKIQCTQPGDSVDVTIYYGREYDTSPWLYKKFNTNGKIHADITEIVSFGTAIVGSRRVTTASFTLTDGDSQTDDDGLANGVIHDPSGPAIVIATSSLFGDDIVYLCADMRATNYDPSGDGYHKSSNCTYRAEVILTENITLSGQCAQDVLITQNMRKGVRNGVFDSYQGGVIFEVGILQAHINRILVGTYEHAAGKVDGIFGSLTKLGVKRLQTSLNTILKPSLLLIVDGIVGERTREAINISCSIVEV